MKKILGVSILIVAVVGGAYLSLHLLLYGGLAQLIDGISNGISKDIVIGLVKIVLFELPLIPAYILGAFGIILAVGE